MRIAGKKARKTAVGVAWYREQDWLELLALFPDRESLHDSYDEWKADAERVERQMKAKGMKIERVIIDPVEFADWCAKEGREPDGAARSEYASSFMQHRIKLR